MISNEFMRKGFEKMCLAKARRVLNDDKVKVDFRIAPDGMYEDGLLEGDWDQFQACCQWLIESLLPEKPKSANLLQACRRGGIGNPPNEYMINEAIKYWEPIREAILGQYK